MPKKVRLLFATHFRGVRDIVIVIFVAGIDLMIWEGDSDLRAGGSLPLWVVPALTAVIYPVLLLRWRYPRAVFILHWTYALVSVPMPRYVPFAGLLVALYALARMSSARWSYIGLCACAAPFIVSSYNAGAEASEDRRVFEFVVTLALWTALVLTVWGAGRLVHVTERRAEQEKREQAAAAVRAERLHLARELHDIVSHSVSAMILQAAGARTLVSQDDEAVRGALEAIQTTGIGAMGELHRLLGLLRAAGPEGNRHREDHPPSLQDLDSLVSSARASGVDVEVVVEGHPTELDRSVGLAAYRIVQEALTNTIKHAGRGASAKVHMRWGPRGLALTIRDRTGLGARGTAELSSGHGLAGLTERVHLVGGTIETGPVAEGFLVQAQLPARPPAPQQEPTMASSEDTP